MALDLPEIDFQHFWRRLQQLGLNGYEARAYMVLVGHPTFKALELAARAQVPRQKIYEVLDSLIEKGFAHVVQERTKLFSAVAPSIAVPTYLARRGQEHAREMAEQTRLAETLVDDLASAYSEAQEGRGTLDYLRIITDPLQAATHYRRLLSEAKGEYLEFSRPPHAVDPFDERLVRQARQRGVECRLLVENGSVGELQQERMREYGALGIEVAHATALPLKMALFDQEHGLIALLDPVLTRPTWTSLLFSHKGMAEAMKVLFQEHWRRATGMARGTVG